MNFFIEWVIICNTFNETLNSKHIWFRATKIVIILTIYSVLTVYQVPVKYSSPCLIFTTDDNSILQQTTYKHRSVFFSQLQGKLRHRVRETLNNLPQVTSLVWQGAAVWRLAMTAHCSETTLTEPHTGGRDNIRKRPETWSFLPRFDIKPALDLPIISQLAQVLPCIDTLWLDYVVVTNDPRIFVLFNNKN